MSVFWFLVFLFGFAAGVVAVIAVEAAGVFFVIKRLNKRNQKDQTEANARNSQPSNLDPHQSLDFASKKQGFVWVLESNVVEELEDKVAREQKKRKDFLEVFPARKYAKVKDRILILVEPDESQETIDLMNCVVEAVSSSNLSSKKWAKRFPIKLESKTSKLYKRSKTLYIYLETSWEKESWCRALRLASCVDKDKLEWYAKLHKDFESYLSYLSTRFPLIIKPSVGLCAEPIERENKFDGYSSKVRLFWKKLSKKTTKVGLENKTSSSSSDRAYRTASEKSRSIQKSESLSGSGKAAPTIKRVRSSLEVNKGSSSSSTITNSGSQSHVSDSDSEDRFGIDEGTLCWNLLISRYFFDVKSNSEINRSLQQRIQRTLSNMRTPAYIGGILCTRIDLGNIPPSIHAMRVLPLEWNEVWAIEVDLEYSGGVVLDMETRLEVGELDLHKSMGDGDKNSGSDGDVSSVLLEDFENLGKQLNLTGGAELKEEDALRNSKTSTSLSASGSRWKTLIDSIAKQVSQVPFSMEIKVASLRGTLRLHIKPPPSDEIWYGFTSMPDIELSLEPSVGEHRITSGQFALFLVNRFKGAFQEALVLPNCESICVSWMLAEKDDWVSRKVAPYIWLNQEPDATPKTNPEVPGPQPVQAKIKTEVSMTATSIDQAASNHQNSPSIKSGKKPVTETSSGAVTHSSPWSGDDEPQEALEQKSGESPDCQSTHRSVVLLAQENFNAEEDDSGSKRMGRKARMLDLKKKMSEKFEEKKRHIEEKSRHIVEKMRGP